MKILVGVLLLVCASAVRAQTSEPSTQFALPEGPLKITITGIEGIVQYRTGPTEKWQRAVLGVVLDEGAEFRTGPRSAVRFTIPPDQTVALDRLGTVKVLRANFENGKLFTDLGMKYGRTRYDIESAGRDHDAKVRSPSSVLAVRGTKVSLYDQPPFAPEAVSLTGRALFTDARKHVAFGGKGAGKTQIDQNSDSPAAAALAQTQLDPKGLFAGRTQSDLTFQLALAAYGGADFSSVGILSFLGKPGTVIGVLPVEDTLQINLQYTNAVTGALPLADGDLSITDPLGQVLSASKPMTIDGGAYGGKASIPGGDSISAAYLISYPRGKYTFTETLKAGSNVNSQLQITELSKTLVQLSFTSVPMTLTPAKPTFTYQATFPKTTPTPAPAAGRSRR